MANNKSIKETTMENKSNDSMEVNMTNKETTTVVIEKELPMAKNSEKRDIDMVFEGLEAKISEVKYDLDNFKRNLNRNGTPVSPNTGRTQSQIKSRELKTLQLIKDLLLTLSWQDGELLLPSSSYEFLINLITPTGERSSSIVTVEVNEGDDFTILLQKYSKITNVYKRIMDAAERQGLTLDGMTFIKK